MNKYSGWPAPAEMPTETPVETPEKKRGRPRKVETHEGKDHEQQ
jgi:hypothetical protein